MHRVLTQGTILQKDDAGFVYKVARIDFEELENGEFNYQFTPYFSVIDLMPSNIFQGIPGLDLSLRKPQYVRKNITPCFIAERTPSSGRENLQELLEEVGMDYLNRLEWLIRCDYSYFGDRFYVERYKEADDKNMIKVDSMYDLVERRDQLFKKILEIICYGDNLESSEITINDENRATYYEFLMPIYLNNKKYKREKQQEGIDRKKLEGGYQGRKKISLDVNAFEKVFREFSNGQINEAKALKELKVSRSTFYRRLKEYRQKALV